MPRLIDAFAQFFDDAGKPLVNGKLKFVESGTNNTDKDTFKDINEDIANSNPVILDGAGRCPNVFGTGSYNVISFTSDDVQIQQFDPVGGDDADGAFSTWNAITAYGQGGDNIVTADDGLYYRSIIPNNQNNNPASSPESWEQVKFLGVWNTNQTYVAADITIAGNGLLYSSNTASNSGNDPVSDDGTNWFKIGKTQSADAAGTVDAITADFTPNITLLNGIEVRVRASGANTSTTPTFAPDGLAAKTIVQLGNNALQPGNIAGADHELQLVYNSTNDNWELLNPANVGITQKFTSTAQTIVSAGLITVVHGLGVDPDNVSIYLECTSAEFGYSVGDKIEVSEVNNSGATTGRNNALYFDSTNVFLRMSNVATVFTVANKTTGVGVALTNANWDLYIRALA